MPTARRPDPSSIERLAPGDLVQLATDVGPAPANVGVLLILDAPPDLDLPAFEALVAERLSGVARLRQRLAAPPPGLGRPYWLDDPRFAVDTHMSRLAVAGDHAGLLAVAADAVLRPLARDRPLWRAVVITGLPDHRLGLVVVTHHVVADGIGGLAVLARLADGVLAAAPVGPPRPAPRASELLHDNLRGRWAALRRLPHAVRGLARGGIELGLTGGQAAPRCSLNAPVGPRRRLATVEVELAPLRASARQRGATVNDALLVASGAALAAVLRLRGERVDGVVVSVPVTAREATTDADLGNQVGVMLVPVPVGGPPGERVVEVARVTALQKSSVRGTSAALVGPVFRLAAATGIYLRWINRQRLITTLLTNVRGPAQRFAVGGLPVGSVIPVTMGAGNVAVAFAALSYAGRLTVTLTADADLVPDLDAVADALRAELAALVDA